MFNGITQEYDLTLIESTGFWGNISVEEFQKQRAIPLQIPVEMVRSALVQAMQSLEIELVEVEQRYRDQGYNFASEVKGAVINGDNFAVSQYKKAVFARAKADLLPEFNTLSARGIHESRDMVKDQKLLLSEATFAIRTLKGKTRGGVWLI